MQVRSATMVRCTAHAPYTCLFVTVLKFIAPIDTLLSILNHRIAIVGLGLSHLAVRERPRGGVIVGGDWQTGQPKGGHKSKVLPGCLPPPSPARSRCSPLCAPLRSDPLGSSGSRAWGSDSVPWRSIPGSLAIRSLAIELAIQHGEPAGIGSLPRRVQVDQCALVCPPHNP